MKKINKHFIKYLMLSLVLALGACSESKKLVQGKSAIKIMSYNIHHGNPPGDEHTIDLDAIVQIIKKSDAAIVALQEVDVNTKRSGEVNQAEFLAKRLNMYVFFSKAIAFDGGEYGLAILSKYPFASTEFHKLSLMADAEAETRILQMVTINIPKQKPFIFANTHLDVLNTGNRILQAQQIAGIAKKEKHPFVLAGDWNATLGSKTLDVLDKVFTRTCTTCPITCPEDGENGAIDFIAYTKTAPFKTKSYQVLNDIYASDHYPILAEIILP